MIQTLKLRNFNIDSDWAKNQMLAYVYVFTTPMPSSNYAIVLTPQGTAQQRTGRDQRQDSVWIYSSFPLLKMATIKIHHTLLSLPRTQRCPHHYRRTTCCLLMVAMFPLVRKSSKLASEVSGGDAGTVGYGITQSGNSLNISGNNEIALSVKQSRQLALGGVATYGDAVVKCCQRCC